MGFFRKNKRLLVITIEEVLGAIVGLFEGTSNIIYTQNHSSNELQLPTISNNVRRSHSSEAKTLANPQRKMFEAKYETRNKLIELKLQRIVEICSPLGTCGL